jgi:hypothetical protein
MSKSPPSLVPHWWRRALDDGQHCERKRRERWFSDYAEQAETDLESAGLIPDGLHGPFMLLYRRGFRLGYDNAALLRERDKTFLSRRRKRAKLAK